MKDWRANNAKLEKAANLHIGVCKTLANKAFWDTVPRWFVDGSSEANKFFAHVKETRCKHMPMNCSDQVLHDISQWEDGPTLAQVAQEDWHLYFAVVARRLARRR